MDTQQPVGLINRAVERTIVEAAVAAPSLHNSQPWRFQVGARRIELYADPSRQLRLADETGRSLLISCGAALFNLRVAAEHLGFRPRVRLLPAANPTLVATVDVDDRQARPGLLGRLYPAIWLRHTNRYPFWHRAPSKDTLSRLVDAVALENARLRIYDDRADVSRIVDVLHRAESKECNNTALVAERAAWVASEPREDGVPVASLGPVPEHDSSAFRDLGVGAWPGRGTAPFEVTPIVALLSSMHDSPLDWVRTGQALQRLLLTATSENLVASFMNQPLEQPDLRWALRSSLTDVGHPQMLMRIGYGVPVPPTPRRPIEEVVRRSEGSQ